ncbi:mitotic spindle assembly checkpoint protein MAD1 [Nilaparvata lugens]|uniref:mitotic spindle assembly checkpoint protein MAD1 n=1 Tax=Nilaparvata lugens TaxID=108931 RepID=UPI00193E291A|nr:mitotic spindle assembly checkpoint protein MAD1 [Nilaparvata lugens]
MQTVHKETLLLFEQEKKSLQQSLEKERSKAAEVEQRLKILKKREMETRKELNELQSSMRQDNSSLEKKCQALTQENMLLKEKMSEVNFVSDEKTSQTEKKLSVVESQLEDLKEELLMTKKTMEEMQAELKQKRADCLLWEEDKAKLSTLSRRVRDLEYEQETNDSAIKAAKLQQKKLMKMYELEKEVTTLREENRTTRQAIGNKLYLENVVTDLRAQLAILKEREQEVVKLTVEMGVMQQRQQEWTELAKHILGGQAASPVGLRQYIETLQQRQALLTSDKTHLEARLRVFEEKQKESESEIEALRSQIAQMKSTAEQSSAVVRRLKRQLSLIIWERNDLREMVDSCQKEFTVTTSSALDMQQNNKVEALEKVIEGYRQRMEKLEADPSLAIGNAPGMRDSCGGSPANAAELEKIKAERNALQLEKEALLKKVDELSEQMEYRALKGDFDIRQNKILHLRMNPISEAMSSHDSDLDTCRAEILRLKERIRLMQEGKTLDITHQVNERVDYNTAKEVEELREKLKSVERQNQKLCEMFKMTGQEFRDAINMLLGYKVDALANKMYRLTNVYSDAPDQHLLFKLSQSGDMELLETPFSNTLGDLIDQHLYQENSIPTFLSSITLLLFQRHTLCISVMPQNTT